LIFLLPSVDVVLHWLVGVVAKPAIAIKYSDHDVLPSTH
jgi:hypothetical protein